MRLLSLVALGGALGGLLTACSNESDPEGNTSFATTDGGTGTSDEGESTSGTETTGETGDETTDTGEESTDTGVEPEGLHAIAEDEPAPRGITVDATHVYWANETTGRIWRVVNTGLEEPELLAENQERPWGIVADDTHVYWSDSATAGKILKLDKMMGGFETLATGTNEPKALAADSTHIYWIDKNSVRRVRKDGTEPEQLATANGTLGDLTLTTDNVYWTDHEGSDNDDGGNFIPPPEDEFLNGQVLRMNKNGVTPGQAVGGQEFPFGIDADSQSIYWVNNSAGGIGWTQINKVQKAPLNGGMPQTLAEDQDAPWGILVHGEFVYYGTKTAVWRVGRDGGEPEMIAPMQYIPRYFTVDNLAVYWTTGDGKIMKLPFE